MTYQSISSYGIIGDMRSAALVSVNGSIDWLCVPRFDSPSVFAAILDDAKGGFFQIRPAEGQRSNYKQFYWPDTNVLVTRFLQRGRRRSSSISCRWGRIPILPRRAGRSSVASPSTAVG